MPRVCSICTHTDRLAIETALRAHLPLRTIAARRSVSKTALLRHRDRHVCSAPAMLPPAAEPVSALAQVAIEASRPAEASASLTVADAGTQALAAYDTVCQHDMSGFPGLKGGLLSNLGYKVELAYQECPMCGIDPARHAYARIQEESRL